MVLRIQLSGKIFMLASISTPAIGHQEAQHPLSEAMKQSGHDAD
jgi:hypothetical protein